LTACVTTIVEVACGCRVQSARRAAVSSVEPSFTTIDGKPSAATRRTMSGNVRALL